MTALNSSKKACIFNLCQFHAAVSVLGWQRSRPGFKSWHTRSFDLSEVMWSEWQTSFRPRLSELQSEVWRLSLLPCVFNVICNLSMTSNHVKVLLWAVPTGTRRFHEPNNVKLFIRSRITFNSWQACFSVVQRREHMTLGPRVLSSSPVSMSLLHFLF